MILSSPPPRFLMLLTALTLAWGCADPAPSDRPDLTQDMSLPDPDLSESVDMPDDLESGEDATEYDASPDAMLDTPDDMTQQDTFTLTPEQQKKADTLEEIYRTRCEMWKGCYPTIFEYYYFGDVDLCVEKLGFYSFMRREVPHLVTSQQQLDACLTAWQNSPCVQVFHDVPSPACEFAGDKEEGEPCVNHIGCKSWNCSYFVAISKERICQGEPRVCGPKIQENDSCETTTCPHNMWCVISEEGFPVCRKKLAAGQSGCAGGYFFQLCQNGTSCDREADLCVEQGLEGASCGSSSMPNCFIDSQLDCVRNASGERSCQRVPDEEWYLPEGSLCRNGGERKRCAKGTKCSSRFDCRVPSDVGGPCENGDDCIVGTFCNEDKVCQSNTYEDVCL